MTLIASLTRLGGLAGRRQLALLGHGRHIIDAALQEGNVLPVRRGWVGLAVANQLAIDAVLAGGRLTGPPALRSHRVWNGDDLRNHIQFRPNANPVPQHPLTPLDRFAPPRFGHHGTVRHWANAGPNPVTAPGWRVPVEDAILRFVRTESAEQVVACLESAVHTGALTRAQLAAVVARMPVRLHSVARRCTFAAGSGLESIARLRLEDLRMLVDQQVRIGPDTVDLVIDGWVVVELDGDEWHDPVADRIRTNRLVRAGYVVLRFGSAEVLQHWDETLATIQTALRARLWSR
ncbi:endonuclease domain-containing protein [Homoserinimonas aerilata]|nr:DUF559 domain-containing protein [Homoserinimonas aerilata]